MAWAFRSALRNAAAVFGYFFSQDSVTMYPSIGRSCVEPWLASARGWTPYCSSSSVTYGCGSHAASTLWSARACPMSGNWMGTNCLALTVTELSLRIELISSVPMLFLTFTPIVLFARSLTVVMPEFCGTTMSWLSACMMEPGASTRKSAGSFAWVLASM